MSAPMLSRRLLLTETVSSAAAVGRWSRFAINASAWSHNWLKPAAISLSIPGIMEGLWDSVLRAVPKKKTSHMKKRHRQMAGKALKDVKSLSTCSGCGQVKRSHVLCPHCVESRCKFSAVPFQLSHPQRLTVNFPLGVKKQWKQTQTA